MAFQSTCSFVTGHSIGHSQNGIKQSEPQVLLDDAGYLEELNHREDMNIIT